MPIHSAWLPMSGQLFEVDSTTGMYRLRGWGWMEPVERLYGYDLAGWPPDDRWVVATGRRPEGDPFRVDVADGDRSDVPPAEDQWVPAAHWTVEQAWPAEYPGTRQWLRLTAGAEQHLFFRSRRMRSGSPSRPGWFRLEKHSRRP